MKSLVFYELLGDLKTQQLGPKKGGFNILNICDESAEHNGGWGKTAHPGTEYEVMMEVSKGDIPLAINRCNGAIESQVFTPPCAPYDRLSISSITATTAMANWERVGKPDGKTFTVNLRKKGTTDITTSSTDAEGLKLSSLSPKTEYEAQLAFTCTDNEIYVTDWVSFTTL